jgi:hypothetical protein
LRLLILRSLFSLGDLAYIAARKDTFLIRFYKLNDKPFEYNIMLAFAYLLNANKTQLPAWPLKSAVFPKCWLFLSGFIEGYCFRSFFLIVQSIYKKREDQRFLSPKGLVTVSDYSKLRRSGENLSIKSATQLPLDEG